MNETVTIDKVKNEHYRFEEPVDYYRCPYCYDNLIIIDHRYCPSCGKKIIWIGETKT